MKYLSFTAIFIIVLILGSCGEEPEKQVHLGERNLDSLLLAFPDSIPLLVEHGYKMISDANYDKAMQDGAKAFRLDSNNLEARHLYAKALNNHPNRTVNDISLSQRHYHYIVKQDPKNTEALVGLAATYSQQQDFEESFKYINEALRIDPKNRDAYVLKGSNYRWLGEPELTKSSYETAVQQDPEFFEAYIMLGSLYQADSNAVCIEYFTTANQLRPNDMDAVYALAYANQQFGKKVEAQELYRKMAADTNEYYVSRGLFHQGYIMQFSENRNIDSAIYFYNSALQTNPKYVEAWHNLGVAYETKGNITRAMQSYAKALKYDPEFTLSREAADELRKKGYNMKEEN